MRDYRVTVSPSQLQRCEVAGSKACVCVAHQVECVLCTGVRRVLAVTADKAEEAFVKAAALSREVAALEAQSEPDEAAVKVLVDRFDRDDSLPATSRSDMKAQVRPRCPAASGGCLPCS